MQSRDSRSLPLALVVLGAAALALLLALGTSASFPVVALPLDRAAVLEAFVSPDPDRVRAALAQVRAAVPAPIEWLVGLLRHEHRSVREWSAHALGDAAPQDEAVVRALIAAFEDEDDYVRWKAARALGNIGPLASAALPFLREAAATQQEILRASAEKAIRQIAGETTSKP